MTSRRPRSSVLLASLFAALVGLGLVVSRPGGRGGPAAARSARPVVALLGGVPGETSTALYLVEVGASALPAETARFDHLRGAAVSGRADEDTSPVVVVADRTPSRDPSFAGALLVLAPHAPARALCDQVVHASRPLLVGGRALVERGRPGPDPTAAEARAGRLREDDLTVDEVELASRAIRTVHRFHGYATHLVGTVGEELILYQVARAGAELVAVDLGRAPGREGAEGGDGRVRRIAALAPFARDFSVDEEGRIVFGSYDPAAGRHGIDRIAARTGARERLWSGESAHPAPHVFGGARVAFNPDGDPGLDLLGDGSARLPRAPLGRGIDVVVGLSRGGRWAAGRHLGEAGGMPALFAIRTVDGRCDRLPAAPGVRYEIAGFVAGGGAP